jgi:hypothetical protein
VNSGGRNGVNGHVLVPKWVLGIVTVLVAALVTWAVQDRRQIGTDITQMREDVASIRDTRFREADGLRMEQELRAYIDQRIRAMHPGGTP